MIETRPGSVLRPVPGDLVADVPSLVAVADVLFDGLIVFLEQDDAFGERAGGRELGFAHGPYPLLPRRRTER
jgi:hypothetical protein